MKHITETDLNGVPLVAGQLIGEVLKWDGNNWVNSTNSVPIDNVIFVSKNGDDGNGEVGDLKRPFLTIAAAETVASSGQLIYVFPGSYTDSALGKNGVSYYFSRGAILSALDCFTTKGNNEVYNIYGDGEFVATGNASATSRIVYFSHTGCTVNLNAKRISGTDARLFWFQLSTSSTLNVYASEYIKSTASAAQNARIIANYSSSSLINIQAPYVYTDMTLLISGTQGTSTVINITTNKLIKSTSPLSNYYNFIDLYRGNVTIKGDLQITGSSNYGIPDIWVRNTPAYLRIYGDISSDSPHGLFSLTDASNLEFYGNVSCNGVNSISSGKLIVSKDFVSSTATNTEVFYISGGKVIIFGFIKNTNNNASAHGIVVTGGTTSLVLKQTASIYTTHASSESINAGAAQNVVVYPGAVANKAVNVNVTQLVGTVTVSANVNAET